jgi:hypothetical protein
MFEAALGGRYSHHTPFGLNCSYLYQDSEEEVPRGGIRGGDKTPAFVNIIFRYRFPTSDFCQYNFGYRFPTFVHIIFRFNSFRLLQN